jgi:hypothetical protein
MKRGSTNAKREPLAVAVEPVVRFEILPCPFCGTQSFLRSCMGEYWVGCENRECQFDTDFFNTPEMAVEIWNDSARFRANKSNPNFQAGGTL